MEQPFKIDFRKWVLLLLPTPLRKSVLYHFIWCLLVPIVRIYRAFWMRRQTDNFYAKYDSSYGNIERMLNILFPSDEGIILVQESDNTQPEVKGTYVFVDRTEPNAAFVGVSYIDAEITQNLFDVIVPDDLEDQKDKIGEVVADYALPGYGFNID